MTITLSPFLADNALLFLAMCIVWEVVKWLFWKIIEGIGTVYCWVVDDIENRHAAKRKP